MGIADASGGPGRIAVFGIVVLSCSSWAERYLAALPNDSPPIRSNFDKKEKTPAQQKKGLEKKRRRSNN